MNTSDHPRRKAPHAVIFDWDNTLIDAWPCILDAYNYTFRQFDMPEWSLEEGKRNIARSLRDSFPEMFGDRWTEAREVYYRGFEAVHLDRLTPFAGTVAMLEGLRQAGVYLGVVSNKLGRYLRREADFLGWNDHFGALVGATDAERDKPDPAPVRMALAPSGLPEDAVVWFVGDSAIDLECAARSGCVPVLMRPEHPKDGEFGDYPPAIHAADPVHFLKLFDQVAIPIESE